MGDRKYDLPPKWNDQRVEWGDWWTEGTSVRFHVPLDDLACRKCGSLATPETCSGALEQPSALFTVAWGRIYVSRCADCGHDTVYDPATDQIWDLDDSDYGDQGSIDPETVQGALF